MLILDKGPVGRRTSYIVIPDASDLTPSGDFTLEFFGVNFASLAGIQVLYSHWNPTGNQRSLIAQFNNPNTLQFTLNNTGASGSNLVVNYTWTPTIGVDYDITFERSGSTVRTYVDGTMVASGTKAGALFDTSANLVIGADNSLANPFNGSCKALRFTMAARYATNGSYTPPSLPLPTA